MHGCQSVRFRKGKIIGIQKFRDMSNFHKKGFHLER